MGSFIEELKRRNVFRVAMGYLILAWVVLQITDIIAPALRLPEWTVSLVAFLGFLGFPFAVFFAWAFELTPEGIKRSHDVTPEDSITHATAGSINKIISLMLGLVVVVLLADRFFGLTSYDAKPLAEMSESTEEAVAIDRKPRSIAVLPFVNMSDDPSQEYFSDGISEELLNALAKISKLRVAARTSSFAFKGKNEDITHIGEQLKVEAILEGSVRKSGNRLRITAQLISVADGYHLWSETYDRELTDIFAVQDEISAAIISALKVHLAEGSAVAPTKKVDIDAYNLLLQARHNVRQRAKTALELAVKQYQQAIDIAPDYAAAWAGKALATLLLRKDGYGDIPNLQSEQLAQSYLDIAFSLDARLGAAHAAQALLYQDQNSPRLALASIDLALAANPSEGILYLWKSTSLEDMADYDAATAALDKAYEIDPLHHVIRIRWLNRQAQTGRGNPAGELLTPDTPEYYLYTEIQAQTEGRWADMLLSSKKSGAVVGTQADFGRGWALLYGLKEVEQGLALLPPHQQLKIQALRNPQQVVDALSGQETSSLAGDMHILLLALLKLDRCDEVPLVLADRNLESGDITGSPSYTHGRFNIAVTLALCLQRSGESARAQQLTDRLVDYLSQAYAKGLPPHQSAGAILQIIKGDHAAAVATLRASFGNNRFFWLDFNMPFYDALNDREDYRALKADAEAHLNSERAKLGWPPVSVDGV